MAIRFNDHETMLLSVRDLVELCKHGGGTPEKTYLVMSPYPADAIIGQHKGNLGQQYSFSSVSFAVPSKPSIECDGYIILTTDKEPVVK